MRSSSASALSQAASEGGSARRPTRRLSRGRGADDNTARWLVAKEVGQFTLAGLIAVAIVGFATNVASRRIGEREAIVDARTSALVLGQRQVEPVLTDPLATGDEAARQKVHNIVQKAMDEDASLVRVKIWSRDGIIVYSDEPKLEKLHFPLDQEEIAALDGSLIEADVSDLSKPENEYERGAGKLLEIYLPIDSTGHQRYLFEAYYRYDRVARSGSRVWRSFAPTSIGALIALQLVQVPLAWSLARRLRERQREREGLLRRALEASDSERRRIASDLHDGVVQDLAGVAFGLSGAARADDVSPGSAGLLDRAATDVRGSIKSLRSLLVEIYPPNLHQEGLETALTDLLARARGRNIATELDASGLEEELSEPVAGLLYRSAQEALRNVLKHARASTVSVKVSASDGVATLDVTDDGEGFDAESVERTTKTGHFGLQGLSDLVSDAGGTLEVHSAPSRGTHMRVEVPLA
ncbi:MAG: two-component system, NarL family, sensor kinase [Acidimicrobiia bacterium]|nr:two-component system, NarL family, sensor kinase [Acidimicrobiia bacterium]